MNTDQNQILRQSTESFRFEIYKGRVSADGIFIKTRSVGHAYLRSGKHAYKVKLFALIEDRFIVVPTDDPNFYKILTKDEVITKQWGKRTYWNVVGEGEVLATAGVMKLEFDLFGEAIYLSLYPSTGANVLPIQSIASESVA